MSSILTTAISSVTGAVFGIIGFVIVKSFVGAFNVSSFCAVVITKSGGTQTKANAANCVGSPTNGADAIGKFGGESTAAAFQKLFNPDLPAIASTLEYWSKVQPGAWSSAEASIIVSAVPIGLALGAFIISFMSLTMISKRM